jgi:hypothetical protein
VKKDVKAIKRQITAERRKQHATKNLTQWNAAVRKAKEELGLTGFVPIGGKTPNGAKLLEKARSIHKMETKKEQPCRFLPQEVKHAFRSSGEIEQIVDESINHLAFHAQLAKEFNDQASTDRVALGTVLADMLTSVQHFFISNKEDAGNHDIRDVLPETPRRKRQKSHDASAGSARKEVKSVAHADLSCENSKAISSTSASTARTYAEILRALTRAIEDVRVSVTSQISSAQEKQDQVREALQQKIKQQKRIIADLELRCKDLQTQVAQSTSSKTVRQISSQLKQVSDAQAARVITFQKHLRERGNGDMVSEAWRMIEEEREIEMNQVLGRMQNAVATSTASLKELQHSSHALETGAALDTSLSADLSQPYDDAAQEIDRSMLKSKNQIVDLVSEIEMQASGIARKMDEATNLLESLSEQQARASEAFARHAETAEVSKTTFSNVWKGAVNSYLHIVDQQV